MNYLRSSGAQSDRNLKHSAKIFNLWGRTSQFRRYYSPLILAARSILTRLRSVDSLADLASTLGILSWSRVLGLATVFWCWLR